MLLLKITVFRAIEFFNPTQYEKPIITTTLIPKATKALGLELKWKEKFPKLFSHREKVIKDKMSQDSLKKLFQMPVPKGAELAPSK